MARLASLLLLGAAAVSAHPNHGHNHAHKHREVAEKRADGDVICATIDGTESCWTQTGDYYNAAATATTTPAAFNAPNVNVAVATTLATSTLATSTLASSSSAAATATSVASSGSSSVDATGYTVDTYTDFDDLECMGTKRATLAQILQVGNTGGSCFGSNMLVVTDADVAAQYDNTIKFYGATEDMVCAYWNKVSKTGAVNGWYKDEDSYWTFNLAAGAEVYVAAQNGTAGGASCFPASTGIEYDNYGAIAGTWLEYTFIDVTTGWSAYDASCIIAENAGMTINGLEVCTESGEQCSSIGAALSSISAAFDASLAAADGIGGNFGSTIKIAANFGF